MGRGEQVPITPTVLRWAISESGFSDEELAEALDVPIATLKAWESDPEHDKPTLTQLKKLATALKRPSATFLLPAPPKAEKPLVEFRHPPGAARTKLNPIELRHLRESARIQRTIAWIATELGKPALPFPRLRLDSDPEEAAAKVRHKLGVEIDQQLSWATPTEALGAWRASLQDQGVLVFLLPLGKASCRGFSLWNEHAPLLAANTHWNTEARLFTLFHEYAHLLTRTNSACIENGGARHAHHGDATERWCEKFAAAVLLPWDAVTSFLKDKFGWHSGSALQDLDQIRKVARHFKVSLRATTLRLIDHHAATWDLYAEIPAWSDDKRPGGRGTGRVRRQVKEDQYGTLPANVFLTAMNNDLLTRAEVLSYLDIPDSDLDRVPS